MRTCNKCNKSKPDAFFRVFKGKKVKHLLKMFKLNTALIGRKYIGNL